MQAEHRLVNNREKVRDAWLDTMRMAADAANPFASPDPTALAVTFAAGGSADPGATMTPPVEAPSSSDIKLEQGIPAPSLLMQPCHGHMPEGLEFIKNLSSGCHTTAGLEQMAAVLREQAPQLLLQLLPENSAAFAQIFTAALLQVRLSLHHKLQLLRSQVTLLLCSRQAQSRMVVKIVSKDF